MRLCGLSRLRVILLSDIEIVSADWYRNGQMEAGSDKVPYGTVFTDDAYQRDEQHGIEGLLDEAVPAVDWRGIDQVDTPPGPAKRKPGRPKGSVKKK